MNYRLKLLAFFVCVVAVFLLLNTAYSALNTLSRLDEVEAQRDRWQRPAEVVQALEVKPTDVVADLGCGSGYFALKLSPAAGKGGRVLAEDIRRLPLGFLWFRAILKHDANISVIHGEPSDPDLPSQQVNEILIANTYHELADSQTMLGHLRQALVSGGRLVVLDRSPKASRDGASGLAEHEIPAEQVETDLRHAQFEILSVENEFIQSDPDDESWWLIVARKP